MTERMSNEEYRAFEQAEKAEVFNTLSDATQSLLSANMLKEYADLQANCSVTPHLTCCSSWSRNRRPPG